MYGGERWIIKKAECQRIDAFELWCWRRLLKVPWTAKRSNQSILNVHYKDWCWSSNPLATWYEELTHWKRPWCWERLKSRGEGSDSGWDDWIASVARRTRIWANSRRWWRTGKPGRLQFMGVQSQTQVTGNIEPTQHFYYCNLTVELNKGTKYVFTHVIMISTPHFFVWICVFSDMTFPLPVGLLVAFLWWAFIADEFFHPLCVCGNGFFPPFYIICISLCLSYYLNLLVFSLALFPNFFTFLCDTLFFSFGRCKFLSLAWRNWIILCIHVLPFVFLELDVDWDSWRTLYQHILLDLYLFHFLLKSPIAFQSSNSNCSYLIDRKSNHLLSNNVMSCGLVLFSY